MRGRGETWIYGSAVAVFMLFAHAPARADDTDQGWVHPELLRIKGELLWRQNVPETKPSPETCFRGALDEASRQGALAWELRAATSLARLLHDAFGFGD